MIISDNIFKQFKSLIPGGQRTIITVSSVGSDGTSQGTLMNGDFIKVQGDSVAAGEKALVVDGQIVQGLGALNTANLTLY
ncbi:hypothetical protein [Pseudoteredinibacter isoporae]|uniref:hypothetical protein n=1 Tax=Pseudoteredinibacter isoporae TaxID=570281 RepID=UPI003106A21F